MITILRIAKAELRTLFYSPIAWFLTIVFLIQCGIIYLSQIENVARIQEINSGTGRSLYNLTTSIFLGPNGLFNSITQNLYLYMPLLTMSLISRETGSGTIKLLHSSPISIREIVFGKFAAMMVYSLLLVAVIGIFIFSGMLHVQHAETGMLLTAMLGFYLILCVYSAIGLFMSSLTTYQVVAAISTFVMIGILSYIGSIWQTIAYVREVTYFLSISGRTQNMLGGLVTTKDLIYFFSLTAFFLGLSIYRLRGALESRPFYLRALRYTGLFVLTVIAVYVSSIPALVGYYDATSNKNRTLTPKTQAIIKALGTDPLEITAYNNLFDNYWFMGSPAMYNLSQSRWDNYKRFKSNISFNTVSYYDVPLDKRSFMKDDPGKTLVQKAEQYAKTMRVNFADLKTPSQIQSIVNLKPERNRYVMQLSWKGRKTFLRIFDDAIVWPSETEVAAAFNRLLQAKLPKIGFLTGHLERDVNKMGDKDYRALTNLNSLRNSLVNQGFDIDSLTLENGEIASDISTLVIADPKKPFATSELAKIENYIDKGGNLLIAGEPGRQMILNPLLKTLGVELWEGMIVQESKEFTPEIVTTNLTPEVGKFYKPLLRSIADSAKIAMPSVAGISYRKDGLFTVKTLLLTDPKLTWNKKTKLDLDLYNTASGAAQKSANLPASPAFGTLLFRPDEGDTKGQAATAISMEREIMGKKQRIIITGDADFVSNSELQRNNIRTANFLFSTGVFSWLSYQQFPIDTSRPEPKDNKLSLTLNQVDFLRIIYTWIMPGILLVCGTVILLRRKKQ